MNDTPDDQAARAHQHPDEPPRRSETETLGQKTPAEIERLMEELQVHQIRLEMQHEELRLAQAEALAAKARYVDLYDFAPLGYCTIDALGQIEQLNLRASQLLGSGRNDLLGRRLGLFVSPECRDEFYRFLHRVLGSEERQLQELTMLRGENIPFYVQLEGVREAGQPPRARLTLTDVTKSRKETLALAASEARFRTLFEESKDAVVLVQNQRYIDCNQAALDLIGARHKSQLVGQPIHWLVPERQPDGRPSLAVIREVIEQLRRHKAHRLEWYRQRCTGEFIWLEVVLTTIEVEGEMLVHAVWRDITEAKRAAEGLAESEARFRTIFEESNDGMLLLQQGRYTACNAAALRIIGAERPEQIVGQPVAVCTPEYQPDGNHSAQWLAANVEKAIEHGSLRCEVLMQRFSGEEIWLEAVLTPVELPGHPTLVHIVWRETTDRRRAEQQLLENEQRLRMALQVSRSGLWEWSFADNALFWDERAQHIFGRPPGEAPATFDDLLAAIHPDDQASLDEAIRQAVHQQAPLRLEHRVRHPDGSDHYVALLAQASYDEQGQPQRLTGLVRDITQRRQVQDELRLKNRLLDHIMRNVPVVLTRLRPDGELLEVSGAGLRRLGVADNQLVGLNAFEAYPMLHEHLHKLLAGQEVSFLGLPPRRPGQVYFQNYGFFDHEQQVGILFAVDVTETEQAKQRLQAEKDFSRSLLDTSPDAIVALDAELRLSVLNRAASEAFGLREADVLGRPLFELLPDLNLAKYHAVLNQVLAGASAQHYDLPFQQRYFDMYLGPLRNAAGDNQEGLLAVLRDVTERKHLASEATHLQLQRQKEVLSAILHTQEDERKRIAEALHNGVGQLLYATKLHLEPRPVDESHRTAALNIINEAIKATRNISFELTPNILEDFGLKTALEEICKRIPHVLRVHLSVGELPEPLSPVLSTAVYRIVQELLNNVMKHAQARETFVYVEPAGAQLHVSVEDDGVGFDVGEATSHRSGIGLSGIRNRVSLLGGQLTIRSQPGRGTAISIELPLTLIDH
ncbi:PAS domain S-box protein [Hymenobacter sp. B81]|uniref:PAS domain S-box protein n=1 Tax=Hymenobacter sp. B81 TaxID=3344878 RepID=UPI0037DDE2CF